MSSAFESDVAAYIGAHRLLPESGSVLLAVSGGADSVAMLHAMHAMQRDGVISAALCVGHVNHCLRGEASDGDEVFVIEEARRLGITAVSASVDVRHHAAANRLSIETSARHLRHEALARMAADLGCSTIATAHHKDDNAETVMHRLLRGTGYRGLAGIWPKKEFSSGITCIRPLLGVSRCQMQEYLEGRGLSWRHDASNDSTEHTRNFIRHRLLPYMSLEAAGSLVEELARLAEASLHYHLAIAAEADRAWEAMVRTRGPQGVELDRSAFNGCQPAVKVEVIQRCLREMRCGEQNMTAGHYYTLITMADEPVGGRKLSLPAGAIVKCHHNTISFSVLLDEPQDTTQKCILNIPGETVFSGWLITTRILDAASIDLEAFRRTKTRMVEWFDADGICGEVMVRRRGKGDRFTPIGSAAEQKVGKFLTAARVEDHIRSRLVLLEDRQRVIWVAPIRPSHDTRITSRTQTVLEVVLTPCQADNTASGPTRIAEGIS